MNKVELLTIEEESIEIREESIEDKKFPVLLMLTSAEYKYINEIIEWYYEFQESYDAGDALASICQDAHELASERFDRDQGYTNGVPTERPSDEEEAERWSTSLGLTWS